jgi:hypothetical protein
MTRLLAVAATLAILTGVAGAPAAAHAPTGAVAVTFTQAQVSVPVGARFALRSEIANTAAARTDVLLAHLNVASLTDDVYVDPEDWSASRSHTVPPIAAGGVAPVEWQLQSVNVGSFDVYVVLLPDAPGTAGSGPLTVSTPVHVTVTARTTLNAGGALPVAIVMPLLLALASLALRWRNRRLRR